MLKQRALLKMNQLQKKLKMLMKNLNPMRKNLKNLNVLYLDVKRKKNQKNLKKKSPVVSYHSLKRSQYLKMM